MINVDEMEFVDNQDYAVENLYDQDEDDNDQADEVNAEEDDKETDNKVKFEYGTSWCPYCKAKINFLGCSHVVYDYDATNCKIDDINSDLMELIIYLILENLPKYSEEMSFFPSFEIDDESEEDEFVVIQRLLIGRERTEELDDFIYNLKEFIFKLRYQDFDSILDPFLHENQVDYCSVEILDTDNRSYCDGRIFWMAEDPHVFEPGLAPLREKYGWLEVV